MTLIAGPDNIQTYRALVIKSGLDLMVKGIQPNKQWTKRTALHNANLITGKADKSYEAAIASLEAWIAAHPMKNDERNEVRP